MKKPMTAFVVLFLLAVVFVVLYLFMPLPGWPAQKRAIEEINRNSNLPFALAMPETELQNTGEYVKVEGFGGYRLENEDVSFGLAGYPDTLDKYHIVQYEIKSSKYTFMGLQAGCSLDKARKVMEQNGYTLNDFTYQKNGVRISIHSSDDVVTSFFVFVETSNIRRVVY